MKTFIFGHTPQKTPIWGYRFHGAQEKVLILGGVHGNEPEGVLACELLKERFFESYDLPYDLTLIPAFNPDGVLKGNRKNSNGVDLNRNLPTKDWTSQIAEEKYFPGVSAGSESENQALLAFIQAEKPQFILSLHSFRESMLLDNNSLCRKECESLARRTGLVIKNEIGYPTPGSLGTFGAFENNIPTLTYELLRGMNFNEIREIHVPAIYEMLKERI